MISAGLRTWFVIHFIVDIIFAIPLLLAFFIPFNIIWICYRLQLRDNS